MIRDENYFVLQNNIKLNRRTSFTLYYENPILKQVSNFADFNILNGITRTIQNA